jgi:hypothetical protein
VAPVAETDRSRQHRHLRPTPKFPELNLVENIREFMHDNRLSNRIFKSCDDLVDHRCEV